MWSQRDPSLRKRGAGNIFIKNLSPDVGPKELHDLYSNFGTILSLKVAQENGVSKGYAFVHYETAEQAETAISKTDGLLFNDQKVYVCHHMSRRERHSCAEQSMARFTNVYVKNLPPEATDDAFREKFASFGEITSSIVMRDAESGRPKGFGFVNYKTHEAAGEAVAAMNGSEWDGRQLYVGRAMSRLERAEEVRRKFSQLREERYAASRGLNVYVKNLSDEIEDARLASEFSQFGIVTSAKVMTTEGGKTRGFGFVCFSSAEEATRAITEMNGKMLCGKPLYVSLAQRREERRAQLRTMMSLRESRAYAQTLETGNPLPTNGFYSGSGLLYPQSPAYSPTVVAAPPGVRYPSDPSVRWGGGLQQPQGGPPGPSLILPAYGPQIPVVQPAVYSPPQYTVNGAAQHQRRTSRPHLVQQEQQQPRGQQLHPRTPQPVAGRPGLAAGVTDVGIRPQHVVGQNRRAGGVAYPPGSRNLLRYARPAAAREAAFGSADPQLPPRRNSAEQHAAMQAPLSAAAHHHPAPDHAASSAPYAGSRGLPTTISARKLAEIPPDQQKQLLGEHLYGNVQHALRSSAVVGSADLLRLPPGEGQDGGAADDGDRAAGKITGMLLEMETGEILHLFESPPALYQKVHEAVNVLREASGRQGALHPGAS
ncbi:MAG: hypothetical protein BJ554DRAFT_1288 [Olpidium bornovanus]|uniref:Polyadenylate-binding protein n=1 Tax=Olpidium bornovanus TaxID=278681 RepID=A0A8H7ZSA2_9FUNG|nr:MAG: hypothetical protein BJ554DRAFT_1288 [Olpidium bornovanus]